MNNYPSATNYANRHLVEQQIRSEIEHGHYLVTTKKPLIISALGALVKRGGTGIRLIHDASRPEGHAVNDLAHTDPFSYQTLQDAIDLIPRQGYLMKCDLSQAYRVCPVHQSNHTALGLKYTFTGDSEPTYFTDTRLPFGCSRSPQIFNELTQAVRAIMASKGHTSITAYLDDFLVSGATYRECQETMQVLLKLLRDLGFWINYNKVQGPAQKLTFLGISLCTTDMTMSLPPDKIKDLHDCLQHVKMAQKITKRGLQSLAGKLSWATQCVYGGRFHLRRLLDRIKTLRKPWHRSRITQAMLQDIHWWLSFLPLFNGRTYMVDPRPLTPVYLDACTEAAGCYYDHDWVYTPWNSSWPSVAHLHINYKEVLALEPAASRWGHLWANRKVIVHTDNQAAVAIINKGSSKHPQVMDSLRRVFWLSALFNFRLHAVYIPGIANKMADQISRLHEPGGWQRLQDLGKAVITGDYYLCRCEGCCAARPGQGHCQLPEQYVFNQYTTSVQISPVDIPHLLPRHGLHCSTSHDRDNNTLRSIPG